MRRDPRSAPAKFTRENPAFRRQKLIEATRKCLAERGASAVSVRAICRIAGVSPGLLTHYFAGKEDLVVETYRQLAHYLAEQIARSVAETPGGPEAKLRAFVIANFEPPTLDRETLAVWLSFWSMIRTSPRMAALHRDIYAEFRRHLAELVEQVADAGGNRVDGRLAGLALSALLDGLWLEWCLDPSAYTPAEATIIALGWVDGLIGGDPLGFARKVKGEEKT